MNDPTRNVVAISLGALIAAAAGGNASAGIGSAARGPADGSACPIAPIDTNAKAEWTVSQKTLPALLATGRFEVRSAYRVTLCGSSFTVYLLQDSRDLRVVYECTADDTYRPAVPCAVVDLTPPARR